MFEPACYRISFLHYTTFIFFTTVFMAISSMFYVNINTSTSQCVFGSSCAFLVSLAVIMLYVSIDWGLKSRKNVFNVKIWDRFRTTSSKLMISLFRSQGFVIFVCYVPKNEVTFCLKIVFPPLRRSETKYSPDLGIHSGRYYTRTYGLWLNF